MTKICIEIKNCKECPYFKIERMHTAGSFEHAMNWFCGKENNKKIQGYVEFHEESKIKIPEWCPISIKTEDLKIKYDIIVKAKNYAIKCHDETNHKYDKDKPYTVHLEMVYNYGQKYSALIDEEFYEYVLGACWTHDTIEDCRCTFNNVKDACSIVIAEITYALTNEKGKTRKERANDKYYEGIKNIPGATFVKICDRLANVKYSVENNSSMKDKYKKEYLDFKQNLYLPEYKPMFDELEELLGI
jgi:hypothetical protein